MNEVNAAHEIKATQSEAPAQAPAKRIGIVQVWNKRYGYIIELDGTGENRIFFHVTSLIGVQPIAQDVTVEYIVTEHNGKPCARQVAVIGGAK